MAQIALGIDIDTRDVASSDAAFDRLEATVRDTATALNTVSGASQKADRGLRLVSDAARHAETRMTQAVKSAATLQQQLDKTFGIGAAPIRDRAADIAAYGAEMDALRAKFNPLFAASKQYEVAIEEIARAEKLGAISANEAAAARTRAAAAMTPLAAGTRTLTTSVVALGGGFTNMRGAVQNAAFQLQDVVVQMQMGTSASRALSMQLPQLLGGFGAVGAVVGLLAGVTIPLLASMMSDAGSEAKSLGDRTNDLIGSSRALIGIHGDLAQTNRELAESYGRNAAEMRAVIELQAAIARADFAKQMRDQVAAVSEMFGVSKQLSTIANDLTGFSEATILVERLADGIDVTKDEARAMVDALLALQSAQGIQQQAEASQRLADALATAAGGAENLEGKSAEAYRALLDTAQAGYETQAAIDASTTSAGGLASATIGARSEANSLADAWRGVLGQVAAAQAAAMRARIELETVGKPIQRAGRLAGYGFDQAAAGVAIVSPADLAALAKAREETVRWREEEARLREEAAKISEFTDRIGRSIDTAKGHTDKAGGSAKKLADEFARAKDVLAEQVREHERLRGLINGEAVETGYAVEQRQKLIDALDKSGVSLDDFLKTMGMTRDEYDEVLRKSEKWQGQLDHQAKTAADLVAALRGLAFGTLDFGEGLGGIFDATANGAFGETLNKAFKDAAEVLSDSFSKAMSKIGGATGLSDFGVASVGTGIGIAAAGALNGNAQQIGSGIGSAIGGAVGSSLVSGVGGILGAVGGPIGMALGAVAGGFISKLFGGNSTWKDATVQAFAGTTYASTVQTRYNTKNEGATPNARAAVIGVERLLKDFDRELREFVDNVGGTVKAGTKHVVDQDKALKAITGYRDNYDAPRAADGNAEQVAANIAAKVAEIMALAGTIAQEAGPALTQAQQIWRATQERFSKENVAILRSLGFAAKEITAAQQDIRRDLARGFNKEMVDAAIDAGTASKAVIDAWKTYELKALDERKAAAIATAKEIGGSLGLVNEAFKAQKAGIISEWNDMLAGLTGAVVDAKARLSQARAMNLEMLDIIVQSGKASRDQINEWKIRELMALDERKAAALDTAKKLGSSAKLVEAAFKVQAASISDQWKDLLASLVKETVTAGERLSFRGSALDELVRSGDTAMLDQWRSTQIALLQIQRTEQIAEAKRLGVDVTLIARLYNKKLVDIERDYAEMRQAAVIDAATKALDTLNSRLNDLDRERSDVLQELTRRAEDARRAEQALADARAGLAGGDLNPGGPMDRFRALQSQFDSAIKAAPGNADAASQAASLAQSLLQAGRGVYASGSGYADLFKMVNQQLLAAQQQFGGAAGTIEKRLDAATFSKVTEQSTKALLTALGKLDASMRSVDAQIAAQTKRLELAQQRASVGVKAS